MSGETTLETLLREMNPMVSRDEFVFCVVDPSEDVEALRPVARFVEEEGLTRILPRARAEEKGLDYDCPCRQITLRVHSSLEAVGFLAAITGALASQGISANTVSGYFHDHLFVPIERVGDAMAILEALASGPSNTSG